MTVGSRVNARREHLFLAFENNCVSYNEMQTEPWYSSSHVAQELWLLAI